MALMLTFSTAGFCENSLDKAESFRQAKNFEEAYNFYEKALKEDNQNQSYILYNMGYCLNYLGKHKESRSYLFKAVPVTKDSFHLAFVYFEIAQSYYLEANYAETVSQLDKAIKLLPKKEAAEFMVQPEVLDKYLDAYINLGDWKLLSFFSDLSFKAEHRSNFVYRCAGIAQYQLGNVSQSKTYLLKAIELNPEDTASYVYLGAVALNTEPQKAVEYYQKAIEHNGKVTSRQFANLYARLGLAYENLNKTSDAIDAYQKAFREHEKLEPQIQKVLVQEIDYAFHLGLLLFKENKLDEAKPYLLESKRLTNAFESNYELGFLFFVQQDYEKALLVLGDGVAQIQKLKISKKGQAQLYKLVAAVWMNKPEPDFQKADQFLKKSIDAFKNRDSFSDLGNLYALQKSYQKALVTYREALLLPPLFDLPDEEIEKGNQYLKEKINEMNNKLKG